MVAVAAQADVVAHCIAAKEIAPPLRIAAQNLRKFMLYQEMKLMRSYPLFFVVSLFLLSFMGCKKEPEYVAPDSSYGLIYTQIFETSCALSACHADPEKKRDPEGNYPILQGESAYTTLINGTPNNLQAANAGLKLVVPNDPNASFLYQKIIFDSSATQFGAEMPSGGLTLTANQILFVRQWIAAGTPLNGHVADRNLMQ